MEIILKEINIDNWKECIKLQVEENQRKFVASNSYSLLQSKYEDHCYPMGIYDGETMVGFLMYSFDNDANKWWMDRLMMDKQCQDKGYGRKAIGLLIDLLKKEKGNIKLYTSFEPENAVAEKLYESIGFRKTGEIAWGEVVMETQL
ncbi:GNAT family N-acetyltransferase [Clostridium sp. UBA6640]|uniref:GNAT family N-acetyltransferase n=1 Tax=Clostridium sp. UBA6640 TaxID=1946370 RepID=UPI0025C11CBD|nr:GNAT family N-acetyltransferase [Clostridium sp. UBA6640]